MMDNIHSELADFHFESDFGSRLISLWLLTGAGGDNREYAFTKVEANYTNIPVDRPAPWGTGWIVVLGFYSKGSIIDVSWDIQVKSPVTNKGAVGFIVDSDISKPGRLSIFDMPNYSTISGSGTITVPK